MYCPECGKQNNDSAKFCSECGKALKEEEKKISIFDKLLGSVTPEEELMLRMNEERDEEKIELELPKAFDILTTQKEKCSVKSYGVKLVVVHHTIQIESGFNIINNVRKDSKNRKEKFMQEFADMYLKILKKNEGDIVEKCINLYVSYIEKMVDSIIASAKTNGMHLEKELFLTELYSEYFDITEYIMPFLERYMGIAQEFGIDEGIRQLKVLTTGNWIGGGRGITGAIIGSVSARVMNAVTKYSVDTVLKVKNRVAMRNAIYQLLCSEGESFLTSLDMCEKSILKLFIEEACYQGVEFELPVPAKITVATYQDKYLEQQIFGRIKKILHSPYKEDAYFELYDILKRNGKSIEEAEQITNYFGMEHCVEKYKNR